MYARPSHINLCHNWGQWTEAPHPAARCFAPGPRLQEPNIRVPEPLQPKNDGLGTMKFQTINNFNVVNLKNMFGTWMSRFFQNSWTKWFPRHGAQCLIEGIATEHIPFSSMIYLWKTIFPQQTVKWPDGRCFFIFSGSQNTAGAADTHCESSSCGTKHICSREQVTSPGLQEIWGSNRKHFQFVVRNLGRAKNHRFNHWMLVNSNIPYIDS